MLKYKILLNHPLNIVIKAIDKGQIFDIINFTAEGRRLHEGLSDMVD